jgi:hypothetical protein
LAELCSVPDALERKAKRSLRKACGIYAKPEAVHVGGALGIAPEGKRRIRRSHVRDQLIQGGANSRGNKETPGRKGIGGRIDNCLVLQERIQASRTWCRNGVQSVTFEIEIDYCVRIGPGRESPSEH